MHKHYLLIGLLVVIPKILPAQFDAFFNLNRTTSHFIQDDTIWLTGRGGVVKRLCSTGEVLQIYTSSNIPMLPYQLVSSVFVDNQHRMWLYLEEKGIAMLDGTQWTSWSQNDAMWVLSASGGGKIVVDDDGRPWIVAAGRSPMFYQNGTWQQPPDAPFGAFDPVEMKVGVDGKMWAINSYGGLYSHDGTAWNSIVPATNNVASFANAPGGGFYTCENLPTNTCGIYYYPGVGLDSTLVGTLNGLARRIAVSPTGRVWVVGEFAEGVAYYENGQWQFLPELTKAALHQTFSVDSEGRLWDTQDFFGTKMYNGIEWQHIWNGPIGFEFGTKGKDGTIWFGYLNTLSQYNPSTGQTNYTYLKPSDKLFDNNMVGLEFGPDGTFYAANQNGELTWYDGNGNFKKTTELDNMTPAWNTYVRMAVDPFDNLYYYGWDVFSDLVRYNARSMQRNTIFSQPNNNPAIPFSEQYFFDLDQRGRLWMNTDNGLVSRQNGGWKTFFEPSPVLDFPEYMVAGVNGVWLYSSIGEKLQYFDGRDTASWQMPLNTANGEQIFKLYVDHRNWLWCLTNQSRLLHFNGQQLKVYDSNIGTFPAYTMNSMFEDSEGNMWFLNGSDIALRLNIPTGYISGQLFDDQNLDCTVQLTEPGIGGYRLVFEDGQKRIETIADQTGKFFVALPPGTYNSYIIPFDNLGKACQTSFSTVVVQGDTTWLQKSVQTILYTPLMAVRISTPFARRCAETTYYVNVCNEGNLATDHGIVTVQLPPGLSFVSSVKSNTVDSTGLVTFSLGHIGFDTCIDFSFVASVGCEGALALGQSLCVTAHVFPDTLPSIGDLAWTGASLVVDGRCMGNSVLFSVKNKGQSSTTGPLNYQVVRDEYLEEGGEIALTINQIKTFEYPADGNTLRFSIAQEPGYPLEIASIAVEGCATGGQETSIGFVTQVENSTGSPFEFTDCQDVVGSFDPNDKQCQPKGWGAQHQIVPGQLLHYNIRFQNTGTDTAFLVVVRDTLDDSLDWSSFQTEISSHPYHLERDSLHRALAFVFDNIQLPDSNRNEPASHGFVQFSIRPRLAVPLGTVLHNQASIYFDFNAAVQTNFVEHRIDTGFIRQKPAPPPDRPFAQIFFAPNPAGQSTWLTMENFDASFSYQLQMHDSKGRLMRSISLTESPFLLEKLDLPPGVYQVSVWENNKRIAVAQVVFL